jgi:anti-sigma B factor antagonist
MNIEIIEYKKKKVIKISGDIDLYSSPELREALIALIKSKIPSLYINLNAVTYIDSSGIATFVEGLKCMKSYGGRLHFFEIPQGVMEIFRFSKLDRVFEIYGNIDDAINS